MKEISAVIDRIVAKTLARRAGRDRTVTAGVVAHASGNGPEKECRPQGSLRTGAGEFRKERPASDDADRHCDGWPQSEPAIGAGRTVAPPARRERKRADQTPPLANCAGHPAASTARQVDRMTRPDKGCVPQDMSAANQFKDPVGGGMGRSVADRPKSVLEFCRNDNRSHSLDNLHIGDEAEAMSPQCFDIDLETSITTAPTKEANRRTDHIRRVARLIVWIWIQRSRQVFDGGNATREDRNDTGHLRRQMYGALAVAQRLRLDVEDECHRHVTMT